MFFYYALFLIFYILGIKTYITGKRDPDWVITLIIAIVSYFVACRVDVGADWAGYVDFYYNKEVGDGRDFLEIEPLFRFSRDILYFCGFSHQGFFFLSSLFSLLALFYVSKKLHIENASLVLLVYVSLFFCHNQLNVLRTCIMASFVWVGFAYIEQSLFKSILFVLIGAGFHLIAIVYLPLLFMIKKCISKKTYTIVIIIDIAMIILSLGTKILDSIPFLSALGRASFYLDPESHFREKEYGLTLGLLFNIILCIYIRFKYYREYETNNSLRCILNILLVNLFLACLLNGFPALIERVCGTLSLTLCFVWPYILLHSKGIYKWHWIAPFTIYLLLFYYKSLSNVDIWGDYSLIPFKFEFSTLFR